MPPTELSPESAADSQADLPLAGLVVVDLSQFLAGPVAAMRLADLGARVIKVERPGVGDIGRGLAFAGMHSDGDTLSFQIMNRNKQSVAADLKDPADLARVRQLIARSDVLIQNFRPGIVERLGLDHRSVAELNPRLVYGSISGYGTSGPWRDLPGQDLLAQAVSGLPWLNGADGQGPVAVGLSIADLLASCHLAQGITALLVRRERTGRGGLVETSLLEGMLDLQFELLSAQLNDPSIEVHRGGHRSASAFLPAPYGMYTTRDGYLAVSMNPVPRLGELLGLPSLSEFADPDTWWDRRDEIEELLAARLAMERTRHWLDILQPADVWCTEVLTLRELVEHPGYLSLDMTQETVRASADGPDHRLRTVRSPLRIDGAVLKAPKAAPRLGEDTDAIDREFGLTPGSDTQRGATG